MKTIKLNKHMQNHLHKCGLEISLDMNKNLKFEEETGVINGVNQFIDLIKKREERNRLSWVKL